jgi:hypothetical protein
LDRRFQFSERGCHAHKLAFTGEILEFPGRGGGARRRQIQENAFESMALALRRFAIFATDGFAQALEIAGTSGLEMKNSSTRSSRSPSTRVRSSSRFNIEEVATFKQ